MSTTADPSSERPIEHRAAHAPETSPFQGVTVSDPDHVGIPAAPASRLQAILPQIKDLAVQVGGLKRLAEIVNSLQEVED